MKRKILTLCLCSLWIVQYLFAQEAKQYSFKHYATANGLASYAVSSVAQDDQGFIWVATQNGLQRFDGKRFITFRHNEADPNSIPINTVGQLLFDKQKRLWIVFGGDLVGIFDTRRFKFRKVNVRLSNPAFKKHGNGILQDNKGNLMLVYTKAEVTTYNEKKNEFSAEYNLFTLPAQWIVNNVIADPYSEKYWIGCDSGMVLYDKATRNISYRWNNKDNNPVIAKYGHIPYIASYIIDSKRRFWFFDWGPFGGCYIRCYDLINNVTIKDEFGLNEAIKQYNEPQGILEQKDGTLWICGGFVFARYDEATQKFVKVRGGLVNDQSINYEHTGLFEDRERNIWVNTNNNGLYVFNPAAQLFNSVPHSNKFNGEKGTGGLSSFIELNNGDILASYWGDGLYRYDSNFNDKAIGIPGLKEANGLTAWSMRRMRDGKTICMVGQPAFIAFYDQEKNEFTKYQPPVFETRTIRQVAEDRYGNLWLGMQSTGIYKWSPVKGKQHFGEGLSKYDDIPKIKILQIVEDSKGFLWIGTETDGLYKVDPSNDRVIEHITDKSDPRKRLLVNAAAILEFNDSLMIIGGGGLNIYNIKTNTIKHITTEDGLPSNLVVSLEKDKAGYVWIGLTSGLCRMNVEKNTFTLYDRNDGMANDNFDVGTNYQLADGRMLFGSSNDFVAFNPMAIRSDTSLSDVSITEFRILNDYISVDSLTSLEKIELSPNQNSITIGFSNLSYNNKTKLSYYYMMEGIDKDWKLSNELNQAVYNYLPPGTYTFKVRTENADRVSGKKITEIKLHVSPPFWKSWWFILLMIFIAGSLLFWIDRLQVKKKEGLLKIRNEIAGNLHEEVNTALSNINILSEMAKIKADTEPGKSKEYIEQIHSKSSNMINAMDDMLWSLSPDNDSMHKTVERMREFIDELKNRYGAAIELSVDKKVESMEMNMKLRHEAFLLFKSILNALVQCGSGKCNINISPEKKNLRFTMEFDTSACDMPQLNNLLHKQEITRHQQMINAMLDMQLHKQESRFVLLIPVK